MAEDFNKGSNMFFEDCAPLIWNSNIECCTSKDLKFKTKNKTGLLGDGFVCSSLEILLLILPILLDPKFNSEQFYPKSNSAKQFCQGMDLCVLPWNSRIPPLWVMLSESHLLGRKQHSVVCDQFTQMIIDHADCDTEFKKGK